MNVKFVGPVSSKIKLIRISEGFSQAEFSQITGISLGMIKQYETGIRGVGTDSLLKVTNCESLYKYTLWLMTDTTSEAAGQIAPSLNFDEGDTNEH